MGSGSPVPVLPSPGGPPSLDFQIPSGPTLSLWREAARLRPLSHRFAGAFGWARLGSNQRPLACETTALILLGGSNRLQAPRIGASPKAAAEGPVGPHAAAFETRNETTGVGYVAAHLEGRLRAQHPFVRAVQLPRGSVAHAKAGLWAARRAADRWLRRGAAVSTRAPARRQTDPSTRQPPHPPSHECRHSQQPLAALAPGDDSRRPASRTCPARPRPSKGSRG